jgi:hypothetical protein
MRSADEERRSHTAEEMESKIEAREEARREEERGEFEDLNQSIQTGTHDLIHSGIRWGPSYKTRRKRSESKQSPTSK